MTAEKQEKQEKAKNKHKQGSGEPEALHWADQIAREVKTRVEADPELKKLVQEHGFLVYDEKTPSGTIHVGSGRGWIIHDVIAKAMRDLGLNARFVLSNDDIDPYDKPNKELDEKEWNKYLGFPFRNMPSPIEGYENFGDYYFRQATEKFEELGIEADLESTGEQYEKGVFNKAIKTILDNHKKVQQVYVDLYGEDAGGAKRIPFNVICENCGKIATTKALAWDSKNELLNYECGDVVKWAKGCGHKGDISPYDGNGKFPWKVEWAAKWPSKIVVCELAGKDHFTKGGSRTCAVKISDEVLDFPPPYPSTRKNTGKGYEFFNIGGKKMSTSKGVGVAFADITKYLPPRIVRYLLVKTRPRAVLSFDPYKDNDIIFLFDRFDRTERVAFGKEKASNEKEEKMQKRIYELSQVGEIPKHLPLQVPFALAAQVIQVGLNEEGALKILKRLGHVPENIEGADMHAVMERLHDAKRWVENYASEQYKFTIQTKEHVAKIKSELSEKQQQALLEVAKLLGKKWDEKKLHDAFYDLCKKKDLEVKEFFQAAYKVLINKERGPRLASFVLALGDVAVELFGGLGN